MKRIHFRYIILGIFVLCIIFLLITVYKQKEVVNTLKISLATLQSDYEKLEQNRIKDIIFTKPLSKEEAETFLHNLEMVNELYEYESLRALEIANKCFSLSREGKMESSWIESVIEHNNYYEAYTIEIITSNDEHFWFQFYNDSSNTFSIKKGDNREILLYMELYD